MFCCLSGRVFAVFAVKCKVVVANAIEVCRLDNGVRDYSETRGQRELRAVLLLNQKRVVLSSKAMGFVRPRGAVLSVEDVVLNVRFGYRATHACELALLLVKVGARGDVWDFPSLFWWWPPLWIHSSLGVGHRPETAPRLARGQRKEQLFGPFDSNAPTT